MIDRCICHSCGGEYGADAPYEVSAKFVEEIDSGSRVIVPDTPDAAIYLGAYCYSCAKNYLDTVS